MTDIKTKTAQIILGGILSAGASWRKLEIIKSHLEKFEAEIRMHERKRCAHDLCQLEGDKIEKSTAVMLCMIDL